MGEATLPTFYPAKWTKEGFDTAIVLKICYITIDLFFFAILLSSYLCKATEHKINY